MEQKSSLIIQILSMLGGLLTAGFFIGFLVLIEATGNTTSCLIICTLLIGSAITLSRFFSKSFLDAINITFYIAGCVIPFICLSHSELYLLPLIGVSLLTFFLSKGFLLPFIAVLSFNLALFAKITELTSFHNLFKISLVPILAIFLALNLFENKLLTYIPEKYFKYKSAHAGFFVSSLIVLEGLSAFGSADWVLSPFIWASLILIVHQVMTVMEVKSLFIRCCIYFISLLICLPTLYAPYLSGSLLLIFVCFHYGYIKEFAASILLFIYSISKYYYDLNLTLLMKSALLFFSGIVFIIAWYLLTQKRIKHGKI